MFEEIHPAETGIQRAGKRLTASDECSPPSAAIPVVFLLLLGLFFDIGFDDLLDIPDLNQHVLWLQVGVDDAAFPMQIVQAEQHLLRDLFDQGHRNAAVIPALDQAQQVLSQYLEDHADVNAVRSFVFE